MKFAMNGALTIGTLDGANVEIRDAVGAENFFLFGLTAGEVAARQARRLPAAATSTSRTPSCARRSTLIAGGLFARGDRDLFRPLVDSLLTRDEYLLLADYQAYVDCQQRVSDAYRDQDGLDADVDPEHRARRAILVGSLDPRLLPRHLAGHRAAGRGAMTPDKTPLTALATGAHGTPGVVAAGDAAPLGATRAAGGVNFSVFSKDADRDRAAAVRRSAGDASRRESIPLDPRSPSHLPLLARLRARARRRAGLRLPRARAVRARARPALRSGQGAARSVRAGGRRARRVRPRRPRAVPATTRRPR